ncbi:MAG: single-stranded-DNA-specific exonuclease RecJ [Cyanophyceae cyanobacterium]
MNNEQLTNRIPNQRWQIAPPSQDVETLAQRTGFLPLIAQVMMNRGIASVQEAIAYIKPESEYLPNPLAEFPDLALSVELLVEAIATDDKIAICGDYDADGMTSTALLLRALNHLGAAVEYAIPSRMKDGYGINCRIVEEFAQAGVGIILTVDNGISATEPITRAVEQGMIVILTDHHDPPEHLPPAHAILNPKLIDPTSPYCGLAGVGVAYILALATARKFGQEQAVANQLLELFTLGTIADLAPLVGVNRRWLKKGLRQLPQSQLEGVQALMQVAGVSDEQKQVQPDDIGFRLGPRINAVGRIADPQVVIELLTTTEPGIALERAMQCEQINRTRQQLCAEIEQEAVALVENAPIPWKQQRVLVVVCSGWHHGVIGIVASRLVERYGVPVFIGTYEDADSIRGSARGIQEFNVFAALDFCGELLTKYGGHKAAGGFSCPAAHLATLTQKLSQFAHQCLQPQHLKPLVKIDAQADFPQLNLALYREIESLQPWGIGNEFPVFWTANVRVLEQRIVGKNHLKLTLMSDDGEQVIRAIAWRWGEYFPLPTPLDIAYKLRENFWNGNASVELELVGARPRFEPHHAEFLYRGHVYTCTLRQSRLKINNAQGQVLAIEQGQKKGILADQQRTTAVDVTQAHYYELIKRALAALTDMKNES